MENLESGSKMCVTNRTMVHGIFSAAVSVLQVDQAHKLCSSAWSKLRCTAGPYCLQSFTIPRFPKSTQGCRSQRRHPCVTPPCVLPNFLTIPSACTTYIQSLRTRKQCHDNCLCLSGGTKKLFANPIIYRGVSESGGQKDWPRHFFPQQASQIRLSPTSFQQFSAGTDYFPGL